MTTETLIAWSIVAGACLALAQLLRDRPMPRKVAAVAVAVTVAAVFRSRVPAIAVAVAAHAQLFGAVFVVALVLGTLFVMGISACMLSSEISQQEERGDDRQ